MLTVDAVGMGHVFSGDPHVVLVKHIPQPVGDHGVDQLGITHPMSIP